MSPTLKEQGIDMAEAVDRGVAVPPGTPEPVIKKLESVFIQVANMPEVQAEMRNQGFLPMAMGHEESKAYVAEDDGPLQGTGRRHQEVIHLKT